MVKVAKPKSTSKTKLSNKASNKRAKSNRKHKLNKQSNRQKVVNLPNVSKNKGKEQVKLDYRHNQNEDELSYDEDDFSDDEMKQFLKENSKDASFLTSSLNGEKKRKREKGIEDYEKIPRKMSNMSQSFEDETKKLHLLPIKGDQGLMKRTTNKPIAEAEEIDETINEIEEEKVEEVPLSLVERLAKKNKEAFEMKLEIATISQSIIENPEGKISSLKKLLPMCLKSHPLQIRKLAILSLLEIFKDIIPSYRIRDLSDVERSAKVTGDVKQLREFEEGLLSSYQAYLQLLEDIIKDVLKTFKRRKPVANREKLIMFTAMYSLATIATKALAELLSTNKHFNFRNNIISVLVPKIELTGDLSQIGVVCSDVVKQLFKSDNTGEISLEIIKVIHRLVKTKSHVKPQLLEPLLSLRINEDALRMAEQRGDKVERLKAKREAISKMSRKERKRKKVEDKLSKELQEAEAFESKDKIEHYQLEMVKLLFVTYFRVLKNGTENSQLLSTVLKGLSKFAHLINIEFFDDLLGTLRELLKIENLGVTEKLGCIFTALKILSGQGEVLTIDPRQFYNELYNLMLHMACSNDSKDMNLFKECLETILIKRRKQISSPQILGYFKRLSSILLQLNDEELFRFLALQRQILQLHKKCDYLLDNEPFGSGIFQPDVGEPELSNAESSALWDLLLLAKHFNPDVETYAKHILHGAPSQGNGSLPTKLLNKKFTHINDDPENLDQYYHESIREKVKGKSHIFYDKYKFEKLKEYTEDISKSVELNIEKYFPQFLENCKI